MSRFKTELCNNLQELGICKYGDRCHYAHGAHELRPVSRRHPKYRTEKCKNFEYNGRCPFGPRCSYVHSKPDLDSMCANLDRFTSHKAAPKPDSEDDDDHSSLFARTESSLSICDSNGNAQTLTDENTENQLVADHRFPLASSSQIKQTSDHILCRNQQQDSFANGHRNTTNPIEAQAFLSASSKTIRTPLGSNSCNVLVPANPQINTTSQKLNLTQVNEKINCNISANNSVYIKVSNSLCGDTSYESNKRLRTSAVNLSSSNNAASNPFAINNPLSDLLNRRNPLHPRKQFYTRF